MDKLSICLVGLTFPPDRQDGEAKFLGGIYQYLKKNGHDVRVITGKWEKDLNDSRITQVNLIAKRFFWFPQFNAAVVKYLRSHDFDVIHGNGPKGSFPIVLARQKHFISTIHDLGPFETQYLKIPATKMLIKAVAERASSITTCSDIIRHELKHFVPKVDLNNIYNLYSAIEEKYRPYPNEAQKLKERLNIDGPIILYIGRVTSYKGINDIIAAYQLAKQEVPNLTLVVGGTPDYFMKKTYEEWKRKYSEIRFVGFVPENEIAFYYSMADIFVTYSYAAEGFGLTPIEAIACGAPVIASSILAFKEVLKDNAILVAPKRPDLLAKEILHLLKNAEMRSALVEKAQKFVQKYKWDTVGKRLEEVYGKFLSR